jgi:hypothetical protein
MSELNLIGIAQDFLGIGLMKSRYFAEVACIH